MKRLLLSAILATSVAAPALAVDLVPFGTSGNWQIMVDPNKGNNCLAQVTYDDGSILRIGFLDKAKKAFVESFNPAWSIFEDDHKYAVSYAVDKMIQEGEARGRKVGDMPGTELKFEDPLFLAELVKGQTLTMSYNGAEIVALDLTGSADALAATAACEEAQKG